MNQHPLGFNPAAGAALTNDDRDGRLGARRGGGREGSEVATAPFQAAQAGEAGGGGAAAPRLEKRTYSNARYRITLRNYGNNMAEIGWSFVGEVPANKAARGESSGRSKNEDRAVRRAKSRLRHLILSANANHLLTLTYRESVTDFKRAADDLNRFVRKVKVSLPEWIYIAVAEQQARGAWHWHLAVRGRQDVDLLRAHWREVVGDGNIDVSAPKGSRKDQQLFLVRYLGKYLVKAFATGQRSLNAHRFRASRSIPVCAESVSIVPQPGMNLEDISLDQLREAAGSVGFVWKNDSLCGWACSWK